MRSILKIRALTLVCLKRLKREVKNLLNRWEPHAPVTPLVARLDWLRQPTTTSVRAMCPLNPANISRRPAVSIPLITPKKLIPLIVKSVRLLSELLVI